MSPSLTANDYREIQSLLYGYAWALDTGDIDGFVNLFSENGVLVWDAFETPERWVGHSELRAFIEDLSSMLTTAGRQHHISNIMIDGDAKSAHAKAYVTVHLRQEEGPHSMHVMGWYDNTFIQESGQWKISEHVIRDWCGPVLKKLAGQTGERIARPKPPFFDKLGRR